MKPIENMLEKYDYTVYNIGYPSTKHSIELLCSLYIDPKIKEIQKKHDTLNFVTHSMGGIIVRYYVNTYNKPFKTCVMLCPPNHGSQLVDSLKQKVAWLYKVLNGPAGQQLGKSDNLFLSKLSPLNGAIGVIAGSKSWEPWLSKYIIGVDDGKVSLDETKLPEMNDYIVLPYTHTFIMNNDDTKKQIVHFLQRSHFIHK
jgi:hypothetical protein